MEIRATRTKAARADYLGGDPAEERSIDGGRLDFDSTGLRFSGPAGAELRLPVDGLLGITISGRAAERRRRRVIRGTMRVAGLRGAEPTEWLFAIDRSAATALRGRVDRELASRGRSPLPFVEELDGFPLHPGPANGAPLPDGPGHSSCRSPSSAIGSTAPAPPSPRAAAGSFPGFCSASPWSPPR